MSSEKFALEEILMKAQEKPAYWNGIPVWSGAVFPVTSESRALNIEVVSAKPGVHGIIAMSHECQICTSDGPEKVVRFFNLPGYQSWCLHFTKIKPGADIGIGSVWEASTGEFVSYRGGNTGVTMWPDPEEPEATMIGMSDGNSPVPDFTCLVVRAEWVDTEGYDPSQEVDNPYWAPGGLHERDITMRLLRGETPEQLGLKVQEVGPRKKGLFRRK